MKLELENASPSALIGLAEIRLALESATAPFDTAEVTQVYKVKARVAVVQICTKTGDVFVAKQVTGQHAAQLVRNAKALSDLVDTRLAPDGPFRSAKVVENFPDLGLIILEHVPGNRLNELLANASENDATFYFQKAGEWLSAFSANTRKDGPFDAKGRAAQIGEYSDRNDEHQQIYLKRIFQHAEQVQGTNVTRASLHGDLNANNLLWDGQILYGIDQPFQQWTALVSDAARFLFHTTISRLSSSRYPFAYGYARTFLEAAEIAPEQWTTALPIFLARERIGRPWALRDLSDHPLTKMGLLL